MLKLAGPGFALLALAAADVFSIPDIDTLSDNGIVQIPAVHQSPTSGSDIKFAVDTSGMAYMIGGCTYGNLAGATHNNDVYRYDIRTGNCDKLFGCPNQTDVPANPWIGGCQAGHAYDITRNCVWFGNGSRGLGWDCGKFVDPAPVYNGNGIWKFECPNGPITKYSDTSLGDGEWVGAAAQYFLYDPAHDYLMGLGASSVSVFHLSTGRHFHKAYPFGQIWTTELPCCFDSKRGLVALTMVGSVTSIWFFNPADTAWHQKTPPAVPSVSQGEMAYDSRNDKYIYFGAGHSCATQIWAYDYDSNAWERMPENGRHYDAASPGTATWPAQRWKGAFAYCEKYNVCVNWGGGCYGAGCDTAAACYDNVKPLWIYRYAGGGSRTEKAVTRASGLSISASPNPFRSEVTFRFRGRGDLGIFSVSGREAACFRNVNGGPVTWKAGSAPAGVYAARLTTAGRSCECKILLMK